MLHVQRLRLPAGSRVVPGPRLDWDGRCAIPAPHHTRAPSLRSRIITRAAAEGYEDEVAVPQRPSAGDLAMERLRASATWMANVSFVAFWAQLFLSLVSAGVLFFSVFVTQVVSVVH